MAEKKSKSSTQEDQGDLPSTKAELVALAIDNGTPSYEAWAMTVDELTTLLKGD